MPNLLVTGKWGEPHVTSAQQRNYNAGIAGDGQYVMSGMTATMTNSNTCHIDPGVASFNGADVEVPAGGVDLTIENGTQGQKRNDLVVLRYTKNAGSQVEDVSLVVIKGTPSSGTAADPAHNEGSILDGDSPCDMPLWRIPLNGIVVGEPVQLFKDFESISSLRETISHLGELIESEAIPEGDSLSFSCYEEGFQIDVHGGGLVHSLVVGNNELLQYLRGPAGNPTVIWEK